jgi:hypothetical protein
MAVNLFIDEQAGRLVQSFRTTASLGTKSVFKGDDRVYNLYSLRQTGIAGAPYEYSDRSAWTVKFGIGRKITTPQSGTWVLDGETFQPTTTAAELQAALRTSQSDANLTVVGSMTAGFTVTWGTTGAKSLLTGNVSQLLPVCYLTIEERRAGNGSTREQQFVRVRQNPVVLQDTWTDLPTTVAATVTELTEGDVGANEVQRIEFNPLPISGTWTITFDDGADEETTTSLPWNATIGQVQAALEAIDNVGAGNVSVSGIAGEFYEIAFVGDLGLTDFDDVVVETSALRAAPGKTAEINFATFELADLLDGAESAEANLEIEFSESGSVETLVSQVVEVREELIQTGALTPVGLGNYLTAAQVNAAIAAASLGQLETVEITANTTLDETHVNKLLLVNSSSPVTIEIPEFINEEIPISSVISIVRFGTGAVDIAVESGAVTLRSAESFKNLRARYSAASLSHLVQDDWLLIGDLS